MNTQVTATNMQVKAVAEDGILISNADKGTWANTADAKITTASLVPTSTAGTATPLWVHNTSPDADSANANTNTGYEPLSLKWTNTTYGEGFVDIDGGTANSKDANEKAYVLLNEFYIKSSGDSLTLGADKTYKDLYINDVTVTSAGSFLKIDNALRVLVVVGSTAYIYAPVIDQASGTTTVSYNFKGKHKYNYINIRPLLKIAAPHFGKPIKKMKKQYVLTPSHYCTLYNVSFPPFFILFTKNTQYFDFVDFLFNVLFKKSMLFKIYNSNKFKYLL